jgi:hypothetical protein
MTQLTAKNLQTPPLTTGSLIIHNGILCLVSRLKVTSLSRWGLSQRDVGMPIRLNSKVTLFPIKTSRNN